MEQIRCNSMSWVVASREIKDLWPWPIKNNIISTCDECMVLYGRDVGLDVPVHIWGQVQVGIRVVGIEEPNLWDPEADVDDSE